MTEKERNDYFYVCSLIEYIARETLNHRSDIVKTIGKEGIEDKYELNLTEDELKEFKHSCSVVKENIAKIK